MDSLYTVWLSSSSPSLTWSCSITFDWTFSFLWKWLPKEWFGRCFSAGVSLVMLTSVDFFSDGGDVLALFNCLTPVLTPISFLFSLAFLPCRPTYLALFGGWGKSQN